MNQEKKYIYLIISILAVLAMFIYFAIPILQEDKKKCEEIGETWHTFGVCGGVKI